MSTDKTTRPIPLRFAAKLLAAQGVLFPVSFMVAHALVSGDFQFSQFMWGGVAAVVMLRLMDAGFLWSASHA